MDGKISKDDVIQSLKQDAEREFMQDILNSLTSKCFNKCVSKPGERLDKAEQTCLAKCVDRFLDSRAVVYETMQERGQNRE
mmetsp:Transcript_21678/g.53468  ORF Transcript_21678/g.53468 Transcript_21678/m.53468 type:complete len:81 (+) Transcript_21678:69-311(+)|eukprot:CAMPEP_0206243260 /NCGR_PEP_ID=MMETSP0047_2-20121206/17515_1 /ASSEMBLY_ACC=CAM_ASM_000192 /TAXON_ID=195065 /ORGANISM="Chroomonas mesostigmatica_cf, Strain CCMP1168" /LENGTH=80 /DNA_ID=CAMNT_0053668373 /DNA_START=69 /DNA_END=311 /DNA_ORIENTATION=-